MGKRVYDFPKLVQHVWLKVNDFSTLAAWLSCIIFFWSKTFMHLMYVVMNLKKKYSRLVMFRTFQCLKHLLEISSFVFWFVCIARNQKGAPNFTLYLLISPLCFFVSLGFRWPFCNTGCCSDMRHQHYFFFLSIKVEF